MLKNKIRLFGVFSVTFLLLIGLFQNFTPSWMAPSTGHPLRDFSEQFKREITTIHKTDINGKAHEVMVVAHFSCKYLKKDNAKDCSDRAAEIVAKKLTNSCTAKKLNPSQIYSATSGVIGKTGLNGIAVLADGKISCY